jgi:hypothetical protein
MSTFMALGPRILKVDDCLFEGEEAVPHVIERIVAPLGLRVDAASPGWRRDCQMAAGCRPDFLATHLPMRTPVAAGRRANPVPTLASTRAGVTKPRAVESDQAL